MKGNANFASLWQAKADLPNSTSNEDLVGHIIPSSLSSPWYTTWGQTAQATAQLAMQHVATPTVATLPPAALTPTPAAAAVESHQASAPEATLVPPAAPVNALVHTQAPMAPSDIPAPVILAPYPLPAPLPAETHTPEQVEMRESMGPNHISRIPPLRCLSWIAEQADPTEL